MGRRALNANTYETLRQAFIVEPGNIEHARKKAGCTWETAKQAWEFGWKNKPWAPSIKAALEAEQHAVRAARMRKELEAEQLEQDKRVQARLDAIQARAEEAQGAKTSRKNAINLGIVSGKLVVLVDAMVNELHTKLAAPGMMSNMAPAEIRKWIHTASITVHRAEAVMRLALEIERIVVGEPIAVIGHRVENMSPDAMVKELQGLARTMERAGKLGGIGEPLLPGSTPKPS